MSIYDVHMVLNRIVEAADEQATREGSRYFNEKRVKISSASSDLSQFSFYVIGKTGVYNVSIGTSRETWKCSCPSWRDPCKHIVASALYLADKSPEIFGLRSAIPSGWEEKLQPRKSITFDEEMAKINERITQLELIPILVVRYNEKGETWVETMDGEIKDEQVFPSPKQIRSHTYRYLPAEIQRTMNVVRYLSDRKPRWGFEGNRIYLNDKNIEYLITVLKKYPYAVSSDRDKLNASLPLLRIILQPVKPELFIIRSKDTLTIKMMGKGVFVGEEKIYNIQDNIIKEVETRLSPDSLSALQKGIEVPVNERNKLMDEYLPRTGMDFQFIQALETTPIPQLYVYEEDERIKFDVKFAYGDKNRKVITPSNEGMYFYQDKAQEIKVIKRDIEKERKFLTDFKKYVPPGYKENVFDIVSGYEIIIKKIPALEKKGWEIFLDEKLEPLRKTSHININVESDIDWFDVGIGADNFSLPNEWESIISQMNTGKRFVRISGDKLIYIDEKLRNSLEIIKELGYDGKGKIKVPFYDFSTIDLLLKDSRHKKVDKTFKKLMELKNFKGIKKVKIPEINGKLRDYQKVGFYWMNFLRDFKLGGILADDMGLGKTIQALTLLLHHYKNHSRHRPSLVVAPTSVITNWKAEATRFTPEIKVNVIMRRPDINAKEFKKFDVIIISYGLLARNTEKFMDSKWDYIVLDEAQYIKNPVSKRAKSAKVLTADYRLALTGTPLENNLIELWSIFDFLMPGFLKSKDKFKNRYKHTPSLGILRNKIQPFILRRMKEKVEKELPKKTEVIVDVHLPSGQKMIYDRIFNEYKAMVLNKLDREGINKARFFILTALLHLRQAALHTGLLNLNDIHINESGKIDYLIDFINEINGTEHNALIFSQFTKFLRYVREELDNKGIEYLYLDGKVGVKKRKGLVDKFNKGKTKFFLISLKAGGTGLNLTGADYVVHLDPWWNPAVENQATDRAHRIGQKRSVFVYKLIAKDTIEEKILQLQREKEKLFKEVLSFDKTVSSLTSDDIRKIFE